MTIVRALVVGALTLSACGGTLGSGEAGWLRLRTPHFTLYTDAARPVAERQAQSLEQVLEAYLQHGWKVRGELPLGMRVVMFRAPSEFRKYAGFELAGYYQHEVMFEPLAVLPLRHGTEALSVLRHELTHHLAFTAIPEQPPWFAEGIASYFETAEFAEDGTFVIGRAPVGVGPVLRDGRMPTAELFAAVKAPREDGFYASAWLLVSYLMTRHPAAFESYQRALGLGAGHARAWQEAFPELGPSEVDARLDDYLREGQLEVLSFRRGSSTVASSVTPMSRADEHALAALLSTSCPACERDGPARVRDSVARALAAQPGQLEASVIALHTARSYDEAALSAARALRSRHPDAWLAAFSLGVVALARGRADEALEAATRAMALAPRQAHARMLAAQAHLALGGHEQARVLARDAVRLRPTSLPILARHAQISASLSDCEALHATLARLAVMGHGQRARGELAEIDALAGTCGAAPAQSR